MEICLMIEGQEDVTWGGLAGAEIRAGLDRACEAEGRDPATFPLSVMTGWLVGTDRDELLDRASRLSRWKARTATARPTSPTSGRARSPARSRRRSSDCEPSSRPA